MGTNMCCLKITNKINKYQLHFKILYIMNSSTHFPMHACKHLAVKLKNLKLEKYDNASLLGKLIVDAVLMNAQSLLHFNLTLNLI